MLQTKKKNSHDTFSRDSQTYKLLNESITLRNLHKCLLDSFLRFLAYLPAIRNVRTEDIAMAQAIAPNIMATKTPLLILFPFRSKCTVGKRKVHNYMATH